ncbi:MAG: DUF554 domain-containing protein [Bacillota bacterium]|nr:DUF554 domain-containing protein [Bacillota bacterium]
MIGTWVNVAAVLVGSFLGMTLLRALPPSWHETALKAVGLAVIAIGLSLSLDHVAGQAVVLIFALVLGSFAGSALRLQKRLDALESWSERQFGARGRGVAGAALTATLIFCVGPMAVIGALEDGLGISSSILFAKSALDGLTSIALSATAGPGVILAVLPLLLYQGGISLLADFLQPLLTPPVLSALSAAGGLLIAAIGLNMTGATRLSVADLSPALILAPVLAGVAAPWL